MLYRLLAFSRDQMMEMENMVRRRHAAVSTLDICT